MRKLFVLFLLVALVPFTVGCNGLWDFDDDDDPVALSTLKLKQAVPAANVVKANAVAMDSNLKLVLDDGTVLSYESHEIVGTEVVITFAATIPTTTLKSLQAKTAPITAKITLSNQDIFTGISFAATKVTAFVTGATVADTGVTSATLVVTVPAELAKETFSIVSVLYKTTTLVPGATTATPVTEAAPEFTINVTGVILPETLGSTESFTLTTKSVSTGKTVTLTASDITYTYVSDTQCKIALKNATTQTETLVNGATYTITISGKVGDKYLEIPGAYRIIKAQ